MRVSERAHGVGGGLQPVLAVSSGAPGSFGPFQDTPLGRFWRRLEALLGCLGPHLQAPWAVRELS